MPRLRAAAVLGLLGLLAALVFLWALAAGEFGADAATLWQAFSGGEAMDATVVRELRWPRALAAFSCGGLLALSGGLMQVLLRNPLADPYVLGVSGGAALAALATLLLGWASPWPDLAAFCGAFAAMSLVFGLARGAGAWTSTRLLLTGVVVAAGCSAGVSLMLALAPDRALRGMLFWLMGDASGATRPYLALIVLVLGLALVLPFARELNLLARGERPAQALGVDIARLRRLVFLLASLLTAVSVSAVGSVGFVGLVVPHLLRLVLGNDQRLLLPAAVLGGGALLLGADTLARTVASPLQLPVGVLTALIGVPLFLWLLGRQAR